ncbi:replication initiator [Streptosporangium sp. NPDC049304]|uniref:replication initiator n=1 Tax=Streptosporangium sp. NPDC049304 TaxID=3154830 RepID=UPI00343CAEA2
MHPVPVQVPHQVHRRHPYAGRRVLVSRKWSNKTLTEHKQDRRTWVLEALGLGGDQTATDPDRYTWRPVPNGDANVPPIAMRLLRSVAERQRWRATLQQLQARAEGQPSSDLSATRPAA